MCMIMFIPLWARMQGTAMRKGISYHKIIFWSKGLQNIFVILHLKVYVCNILED